MAVKIEKTISMGNILTIFTIIGSVISFLITWNKGIDVERAAQAQRIRASAAITMVKLDRWKMVTLSLFDQIKPDFINTKQMLKKNYNLEDARDLLHKALHETRADLLKRASDDQVEMAYLELYSYFPEIRDLFQKALFRARKQEEHMFAKLTHDTDHVLEKWAVKKEDYETAALWKKLTEKSIPIREDYMEGIDSAFGPLFETLNKLITLPDDKILLRPDLLELSKDSRITRPGKMPY